MYTNAEKTGKYKQVKLKKRKMLVLILLLDMTSGEASIFCQYYDTLHPRANTESVNTSIPTTTETFKGQYLQKI